MGAARKQFDLLINAITTVVMLTLVFYSDIPNELAVAIVGLVACALVFGGALYDDRHAAAAVPTIPTTETPPTPPTQPVDGAPVPARRTPKPPKDTGTTKGT
jgi:hypothetical protein